MTINAADLSSLGKTVAVCLHIESCCNILAVIRERCNRTIIDIVRSRSQPSGALGWSIATVDVRVNRFAGLLKCLGKKDLANSQIGEGLSA